MDNNQSLENDVLEAEKKVVTSNTKVLDAINDVEKISKEKE